MSLSLLCTTDRALITGRIRHRTTGAAQRLLTLILNHQLDWAPLFPSPTGPATPLRRAAMPAKTPPPSLGMVPQEVLEHIAFFAATDGLVGPPAGIVPLLSLNRAMHDALSFKSNPHLYARIFAEKFDDGAPLRRLGVGHLHATALAEELQRRSLVLKRIRARLDSKASCSDKQIARILWTAYLMVLENDGKNERQLLEYAHVNEWLKEYLFDIAGASNILKTINEADKWALNSEQLSLALWIFWYLLRPGTLLCSSCLGSNGFVKSYRNVEDYLPNDILFRHASGVLKVIALGAHKVRLRSRSHVSTLKVDSRSTPPVIPTG